VSLTGTLRSLPPESRMTGGAALALIVSLFLPWYGASGTADDTLTAWDALGVIDVILALIAAFAISVTIAAAVMRVAAVPIALEAIATLFGLVALLLVLIRVLDLPDGATGREAGVWIALVGAAGIFAGAGVAMRDERLSPAGRHTDATGRPVPKPPEIEPMPAPPPGAAS
jgi:hypothetical protein